MPARLRPKAPLAGDAILVGDPGRALLLAQELLEKPQMTNHARGLWGYSGPTPAGGELTIQATGMGGPSAAIVLADLAKLGVRRAVRIGTCAALGAESRRGELLVVSEAIAAGGSATSFGVEIGEAVPPDPALFEQLRDGLRDAARAVRIASFDAMPEDRAAVAPGIAAADLQTVAVLAVGRRFGVAAAALLIVTEATAGEPLADEGVDAAAKRAGHAASAILSG